MHLPSPFAFALNESVCGEMMSLLLAHQIAPLDFLNMSLIDILRYVIPENN